MRRKLQRGPLAWKIQGSRKLASGVERCVGKPSSTLQTGSLEEDAHFAIKAALRAGSAEFQLNRSRPTRAWTAPGAGSTLEPGAPQAPEPEAFSAPPAFLWEAPGPSPQRAGGQEDASSRRADSAGPHPRPSLLIGWWSPPITSLLP